MELVRRHIELARPRAMRPKWNSRLGREIYVPRSKEEEERRKIKRIDLQFKRKEVQIKSHCIRQRLPKRCEKEIFHLRIRVTVCWRQSIARSETQIRT